MEWNKTIWCQRERWHHLPYVTHIAGQAVLMTSQSRLYKEHLLPTYNMIVLDWFFNLTRKSNLNIFKAYLQYALKRFF